MKTILTLITLACCISLSGQQIASSDSTTPDLFSVMMDSTGKITDKYHYRRYLLWGSRLGSDGDPRTASTAYVQNLNRFLEQRRDPKPKRYNWGSNNTPQWTEKGPIGKANQSFLDADGVGRINRITFDPNYNLNNNFTLYAASEAGGLWRSEDDGLNWYVCGTDQADFPTTAISDIVVHPCSSNVIFVAAGNCDKRPSISYNEDEFFLRTVFNHQFTMGVWRGEITVNKDPITNQIIDIDVAWTPVKPLGTNGFLTLVDLAGDGTEVGFATVEKLAIRIEPGQNCSTNPKIEIWAASSKGILRNLDAEKNTGNGNIGEDWEMILPNPSGLSNASFRGIVFKEGAPNTIYVSGRDVYEITNDPNNNNQTTWSSITGSGTGLHYPNILAPNMKIERINIETAPAPSGQTPKLWAYIIAKNGLPGQRFVYEYDETQPTPWSPVASGNASDKENNVTFATPNRSDIAIFPSNPVDPNKIFVCGNGVLKVSGSSFVSASSYKSQTVHADIHALGIPPNTNGDITKFKIFCGHDGGISMTTNPNPYDGDWVPRMKGIGVARQWGFDDGVFSEERFIMALQDITMKYKPDVSSDWLIGMEKFGEGFAAQIDERQGEDIIYAFGGEKGYKTYNINTSTKEGIAPPPEPYIPTDAKPSWEVMMRLINHPRNAKVHLTAYELARLEGRLYNTNANHQWKLITDKGFQKGDANTGKFGFTFAQRWSNAAAISPSNPDVLFVARSQKDLYDFSNNQPSLTNPYSVENNPDWPSVLFRSIKMGYDPLNNDPGSPGGCDLAGEGGNLAQRGQEICVEDITMSLLGSIQAVSPSIPLKTKLINGVNKPTLPPINAIVFDPKNENRVWICFSGFRNQLKVWYTADRGDTWQNWDPNGDLDNLPVNDMAYQRGTNDRLIIATDRGVYMKESTGPWERYGEGLPNVLTTNLHINYCAAKIRVGTWGRGAWEADLYPFSEPFDEYVISPTDPWVYDVSPGVTNEIEAGKRISMDRNIRIQAGVEFIIRGELSMPADGRIIVEPGAKLLVEGGTITNFCGETWYGIFAGGYSSFPQVDPTTFPPGQFPPDHAWVVLKDRPAQDPNDPNIRARIEYSRDGIHNYDEVVPGSGGIIQATNTDFYNNRRSIAMVQYVSPNGHQDLSYFKLCNFTVDNSFREYDPFMAHVTMWDVRGISFRGCSFINDLPNTHPVWVSNTNVNGDIWHNKRGAGIYSLAASFHVNSENGQRSRFERLTHGIYSGNTSNLTTFFAIESDFVDNIYGVQVEGTPAVEISNNTFIVGGNLALENALNPNPGEYVHKGIILSNCTGFYVGGNTFTTNRTDVTSDHSAEPVTTGIEAINTAFADNKIGEDNHFSNFKYANRANCYNRSNTGTKGLIYDCNKNTNNFFDFYVDDEDTYCGDIDDPQWELGIRKKQGDGSYGAGNTFSSIWASYGQHFNNKPPNADIDYFFYDQDPLHEPFDYRQIGLNFTKHPTSEGNGCGSDGDPWESPVGLNDLLGHLDELDNTIDNIQKKSQSFADSTTNDEYEQKQANLFLKRNLLCNTILRQMLKEPEIDMQVIRAFIKRMDNENSMRLLALSWQSIDPENAAFFWEKAGLKQPPQLVPGSMESGLEGQVTPVRQDWQSMVNRITWAFHTNEVQPSHTYYKPENYAKPPEERLSISEQILTLVPNPAQEECKVIFPRISTPWISLNLLDMQGKVILEKNVFKDDTEAIFDLKHVPPGIYFVKLYGEKRAYSNKLIVVK